MSIIDRTVKSKPLHIMLDPLTYQLWDGIFEWRRSQVEGQLGAPRYTQRQLLVEMLQLMNEKMQTEGSK